MTQLHRIQLRSPEPCQEYLQKILDYDSSTGVFRWKTRLGGRTKVGTLAGCRFPHGDGFDYWVIGIHGRLHSAHRLAWVFVNGEIPLGHQIDHRNGDTRDNQIENLRLASVSRQRCNHGRHPRNTSGRVGVLWKKDHNKWKAFISFKGRQIHLGYYDSFEAAAQSRANAEDFYYGEFRPRNAASYQTATPGI